MFTFFCWWITTRINFFLSGEHFILHRSIIWEFSHPGSALHKQSSLHPPSKLLYRCLATSNLMLGLVSQPLYDAYWMPLAHEKWNLCRNLHDAFRVTGFALSLVSFCTSTAISVDRLLALLLRLIRYRQIVTLKRAYITVATFWILSGFTSLWFISDLHIAFLLTYIITASSLLISIASNIKIFRALINHRAQVQDLRQSHSNAPNIVRFKLTVNGALWVQLALVVCSVPYSVVANVIKHSKSFSSHMIVIWGSNGCFNIFRINFKSVSLLLED